MGKGQLGLSRRKFLQVSGAAASSIAAGGLFNTVKATASEHSTLNSSKGKEKFIPSACGMCVNKCGLVAHVADGRIEKLNPNHKFFKSRSMLCARGNAGAAEPYNPDRLKKPLLRVGKRGEGKWKEISWKEAYKLAAEKLAELKQKYQNRSSVAFVSTEGFQEEFFNMLSTSYGSTNTVRHPTLCLASVIQGWSSVFGTYPDADLTEADFVLMLGANRAESFVTPDTIDFQKSMPKKQTLVYVDPRFTSTAAKSDKWYAIKPGTDLAFVLALIHVIVNENLYDENFVNKYTYGFEDLVKLVKQYTPEWAEKECEIQADEIRWIAREYAKYAPRSVVYPGRRTSWYVNDVYFRRACAILTAITGSWDEPGGIVPKSSIPLNKHDGALYPFYEMVKPRIDVSRKSSIKNLIPNDERAKEGLPQDSCAYLSEKDGSWIVFRDSILKSDPYPVKGMFVFKQNPVEAVPNREKTLEMMQQMEFICTIDIQMSDTAWYSDLVLPESTYLERWDPCHSLSGIWPIVVARQPVIEPIFDTKSMKEITAGIVNEMLKIPSLWDDCWESDVKTFKETVVEPILNQPTEKFIEHQLSKYPGAYEMMLKEGVFYLDDKAKYGKIKKKDFRYKTKTGKIEIYNVRYENDGLNPLPVYASPPQPKPNEFRMILGRHAWNTHSGTQNNEYLHEIEPENAVWINDKRALELGIMDGDYVYVKSPVGEQKIKAKVTRKIRPDCIFYTHGFGRLSKGLSLVYKTGASQAAILEDYVDSISGNAAMHETFVEIRKA
ncbi:Nitrate reductase [Flexistipes sinusarabici DSM 4947]|uniref:Nitrate reductase n=1 Tax=Flexistipes sinusarabici (strain ATCC 49648 / DSM 4947 / MAS 10) TaxID=717231 RepID=F8E8N9_FLESM|nr:molybdopterin-dependent oxidoreductase [Flexistipes sinusarabici]AEI15162.1 Nitrate reductase [Flexistipes sinusarabici DSM 4947]